MKNSILYLAVLLLLSACQGQSEKAIYQGQDFSVYSNGLIPGNYTAKAHSPLYISSDYQSAGNANFPKFIEFKLAINGKDNKMLMGMNHSFVLKVVDNNIVFPKLTLGSTDQNEVQTNPTGRIGPNTA